MKKKIVKIVLVTFEENPLRIRFFFINVDNFFLLSAVVEDEGEVPVHLDESAHVTGLKVLHLRE